MTLRVGIIGTGAIAGMHARAYKNIGFTVRACTNVTQDKGRAFAAEHGADGREQPGSTPTIAGAPNVVGPAGIPIRVLLHGKEGPIGLMPAHGDTLSDADMAAVLTYIRRAWGQTATPIDAAEVQKVRAATAGRTRAWTPEELAQIK